MNCYTRLLFFLVLFILSGCSTGDDEQNNLECDDTDDEVVIGIWNNPSFVSTSGNCYLEECIDLYFELNTDASYHLEYKVYDSQSNSILREFDDQGVFDFKCEEKRILGGLQSGSTHIEGKMIFNSDSIARYDWILDWNGGEGLIILPEYLGFTHDAYIRLGKS